MANITTKGRELMDKLAPSIGIPPHMAEICSLIAHHGTSYGKVQEAICNGHPANADPHMPIAEVTRLQERHEAWCEKREAALERQITKLAKSIGAAGVIFNGDPRGATVKLVMPDGRTDDFGAEGICVPGA